MVTTAIVAVEVLLLLGSLIDFSRFRLILGRDVSAGRKILAGQAVLVLMLVVFLQLVGNAQGQQRDAARKTLAGRLGAAIQTYTANSNNINKGFTCKSEGYCGGIVDPDTFTQPTRGAVATAASGVVYTLGKNCAGAASPTAYAIYYWQEGAGRSQCLDAS